MNLGKYIKVMKLYKEADPEKNFSYITDSRIGTRVRFPRDKMYIVFPSEFKEADIVGAINDIFSTYLNKTSYAFTYKILHNIISDALVSLVDDSENFDENSIVLELQGMPESEVKKLAEVVSKFTAIPFNSVIVIDSNKPGYYLGDFYIE